MKARYVRTHIVGAVSAILVSLFMWITQVMYDRASAPIFAQGLDAGETVGCEICLLRVLALAIIFALTGVAAVAWCGRLISGADDAKKAAVVAGAIACVISGAVFLVPFFQQQIHNNAQIYNLGTGYTVYSFVIIVIGAIIAGVIYLCIGSFCAFFGGYLYYLSRRKKSMEANHTE